MEITASYLSNVFSKDINCKNRNSNKTLYKICTLIYLVKLASHFKADSMQTKFNKFCFRTLHCTVKRVHVEYIVKIKNELSLTKVQYVGLHYTNPEPLEFIPKISNTYFYILNGVVPYFPMFISGSQSQNFPCSHVKVTYMYCVHII